MPVPAIAPMIVTITVPTALVNQVTDALCAAGGYQSSEANVKQAMIDWVTSTVQNVQASQVAIPTPPPKITGLT